MSVVTLENGVVVPIHWNDFDYQAECGECGQDVYGKTPDLIKEQIEQHACSF
jgi:hypothetical protein